MTRTARFTSADISRAVRAARAARSGSRWHMARHSLFTVWAKEIDDGHGGH